MTGVQTCALPICIKLVLAFMLLAVPTLLIGATLPVLSRYIIREKKGISLTVSQLYAYNTFGAIIGVVAAGYLFLPHLGIKLTNLVAVGISFIVAGGFYLTSSIASMIAEVKTAKAEIVVEKLRERITPVQKMVIIGFSFSGAAAMFYEVAWTRTQIGRAHV